MTPEKENTFRALKDEPPLSTQPWRCMIGLHRWLKWSDPQRSSASMYIRQGRFCAACNQYDERKARE
jgi:hypothetical protein